MKLLVFTILFASIASSLCANNLTCYQCTRTTDEDCGIEDLKQCSSDFDRCAIHFTKNDYDGFSVKRECGLAPCGLDDKMASTGLGMNCDRSKKQYSCTYCCRGNACNQNGAARKIIVNVLAQVCAFLACYFIVKYLGGNI